LFHDSFFAHAPRAAAGTGRVRVEVPPSGFSDVHTGGCCCCCCCCCCPPCCGAQAPSFLEVCSTGFLAQQPLRLSLATMLLTLLRRLLVLLVLVLALVAGFLTLLRLLVLVLVLVLVLALVAAAVVGMPGSGARAAQKPSGPTRRSQAPLPTTRFAGDGAGTYWHAGCLASGMRLPRNFLRAFLPEPDSEAVALLLVLVVVLLLVADWDCVGRWSWWVAPRSSSRRWSSRLTCAAFTAGAGAAATAA